MKIQVTYEDIDNGVPNCKCNCPIALAIQDVHESIIRVLVYRFGIQTIVSTGGSRIYQQWFDLPISVKGFMGRFDASESCEPFEFELAICT